MSFSKSEYEKIMHFINSTHSATSNISHTMQAMLAELFNYHHSLFWLADKHSNMYNLEFFNHQDKLIWDYTEDYDGQDIMHPKKQLSNIYGNKNVVFKIQETTTPSSFTKSEYYSFFRKHNMIDQMVLYFLNGKSIYGGIGLSRFKGEQPFSKKDKDLLQALSVHLQYLVKNMTVTKELEARSLFLNKESNQELGIIQIQGPNISFYNETAQNIIETIGTYKSVEEFYQTTIKSNLPNQLSQDGNPPAIRVSDWNIKVIPRQVTQKNKPPEKYFIYLYPHGESTNENENKLISLLSKRESELFDLVLKGYTNEQISNELFISINTVKKHLRNMYDKLDVSNRTALIYKLN